MEDDILYPWCVRQLCDDTKSGNCLVVGKVAAEAQHT